MAKIAIFDSGLGSLSIIKPIQSISRSEIIYFADQQNYPYGTKSKAQLSKIIQNSIKLLQTKFSPDIIVVASNTPSIMLDVATRRIVDVKPPLTDARKRSKTRQIGILATDSAASSKGLARYIKENNFPKTYKIFKINASDLVELVESGKFISKKKYSYRVIRETLDQKLYQNNIDTITLSSTHLPFLKPLLQKQYPDIDFLDPADMVAKKVYSKIRHNQSKTNSLRIFASGNTKLFQTKLAKIGIRNKVNSLSF